MMMEILAEEFTAAGHQVKVATLVASEVERDHDYQIERLSSLPGPQIHDSWALPQWGRVRFNTANRGGSSCRLRYHYARILMRRSCGVWPGEAKMALKPDGFWRLRRSMTVRRAPRRPRSAAWGFRSSGTGCCASTLAGLTLS